MVTLRNTKIEDLSFILEAESFASRTALVNKWTRDKHISTIHSGDWDHLIIEGECSLGYLIGKRDCDNYELMRIVITKPGKGYGKTAIRELLQRKFDQKIHRFWLDVRLHNEYAIGLYKKMGFKEEAVLRDAVKHQGGYISVMVMSILRSEYEV